jgi:dimethylglycine dehydrogenase
MQAVSGRARWARWPGIYLPLHPMEHQYLVTDEVPEIAEMIARARASRM